MAGSAHAQYGTGYITYNVAFPMGETKDFVGAASWRGIGVGVRRFLVSPNIAVGITWQWNTFQETTRDLIEMDGVTVSGDQVRRIYVSPILVNGAYHFSTVHERLPFEPFVGLGIGAYYVEKRLDIGIARFEVKNWHFGLEPRAGVYVPVYTTINAVLTFSYHYIFKAGDGTNHSFVDVGVGLAYRR
jgi:opacity protein-like surface antigen